MVRAQFWRRLRRVIGLGGDPGAGVNPGAFMLVFRSGSEGVNNAIVLTFSVSALALVVTVFHISFRRSRVTRADLVAAGLDLANQVLGRERAEQQHFLRTAVLAGRLTCRSGHQRLLRWRTDEGDEQGTLSDVARYYGSLKPGRRWFLARPERVGRSWRISSCWI